MEKNYDLESRTEEFARKCRQFVCQAVKTLSNIEDFKQLVRSSGSTAANYIEANESLSNKDYFFRARICRKEAKESHLWLKLIDVWLNYNLAKMQKELTDEAMQLARIFCAIVNKQKNNQL